MDEPTYAQVNTIYNWISWAMPTAEAQDATKWMKEHKNRKEVSVEMNRLHDLKAKHALTRESVFENKFWEGYFKR